MTPSVSVVVPLHVISERFYADLERLLALDYPDYEVIVVVDKPLNIRRADVRELVTGRTATSPAEKRDFALPHCRGEICAFIDDDAYPDSQWLKNAARYFQESDVAGVGGPGLTPPEDALLARAGGAVYESRLGSGGNAYRFRPLPRRDVDDYPAYNLLIRRSVLDEVGGFASRFYGGEDTKVCLAITRTGRRIVYAPDVIVYHHRRPLFGPHLRQIYNVGLHRGFFVKAFPQTSRRLLYFLPAIGLLTAVSSLVCAVTWPALRPWALWGCAAWCLCTFASVWATTRSVAISALASLGITATHVTYASAFMRGLTVKHLDR